ncbi:MAG: hypothetical protein KF834_08650 [Burkholderiales bacterium]|nr:hypothetical protein [Burkholderiales bacterium]
MSAIFEFVSSNAALLAALVALVVSLRASHTAHQAYKFNVKNKSDAERIVLFEKKRELLNEVDRQHTRFATLMMLTAQKILLFREHPSLHGTMPNELERLKNNLRTVQHLAENYEEQRKGIQAIDVGADIAVQEELLANVRRLTIHVEKDIAHEQAHLSEIQERIGVKNRA